MWMTEKKYKQLKAELRQEISNDIDRRLSWSYEEAQEYANKEVKWALEKDQEKEIRGTALKVFYELIETPPHGFIEALVKKINNVQLEK